MIPIVERDQSINAGIDSGLGRKMADDNIPGIRIAKQFIFGKTGPEIEQIVTRSAIEKVRASPCDDDIVATAAKDRVVPVEGIENVVAVVAHKHIADIIAPSGRAEISLTNNTAKES